MFNYSILSNKEVELSSIKADLELVDTLVKGYKKVSERVLKNDFIDATIFAYEIHLYVCETVIGKRHEGQSSYACEIWNRFAKNLEFMAKYGISSKVELMSLGEKVYRLEREMYGLALLLSNKEV